jgi:hypothetical protein
VVGALGMVYRLGVSAAGGAEVCPVGGQPRGQPGDLGQWFTASASSARDRHALGSRFDGVRSRAARSR